MKNSEKISKIERRQIIAEKPEPKHEDQLRFYLSDDSKMWKSFYLSEDACIDKVIPDSMEQGVLSAEQISALFQEELEKYVLSEEILTKSEVVKIQNIILLALRHDLEIPDSLLTKIEEKEEEQRENPVKITGFDKIDLRELGFTNVEGINAEDVLRKAMEILPDNAWANVEKIEYDDKIKPMSGMYGFEKESNNDGAESAASFDPRNKFIIFHKFSLENKAKAEKRKFIVCFADRLLHEWAHSTDPRLLKQKDLSNDDCREMLLEWERVRKQEPPFSSYVKKIKNKNKLEEDRLKSGEDFAESMAYTLSNPLYLREHFADKRQEFCMHWLKKRFPKYSPEKTVDKIEEYYSLLDSFKINVPKKSPLYPNVARLFE